jgi:hypothetical protein
MAHSIPIGGAGECPAGGSSKLDAPPAERRVSADRNKGVMEQIASALETIAFSALNGSAVMLAVVRDGSKSRIPKDDRLTIGNVSGGDDPFVVEIHAHVVHWSHRPARAFARMALGLVVARLMLSKPLEQNHGQLARSGKVLSYPRIRGEPA